MYTLYKTVVIKAPADARVDSDSQKPKLSSFAAHFMLIIYVFFTIHLVPKIIKSQVVHLTKLFWYLDKNYMFVFSLVCQWK